jgi:hypothetical protein
MQTIQQNKFLKFIKFSELSLWEGVLNTYNDKENNSIFNIEVSANLEEEELRKSLLKHKI